MPSPNLTHCSTGFVVEVDPFADHALGVETVGHLDKIDGFIFQRPPETFDEDIVHAAATPVHGSLNSGIP